MYRFEDLENAHRLPGDTLTVRVRREDFEAFIGKSFSESSEPEANKRHVEDISATDRSDSSVG